MTILFFNLEYAKKQQADVLLMKTENTAGKKAEIKGGRRRHLSLWIRSEASLWSELFSYLIEFVFLPKSVELSLCLQSKQFLTIPMLKLSRREPAYLQSGFSRCSPSVSYLLCSKTTHSPPAPHWGVSPVLPCLWFFFPSEPLRTPSTTASVSIPFCIKQDKMKRPLRWQRPQSALYFSRVPDAAQEAITWQMFVDLTNLSSLGSPWSQSRNFITSCLILKKCRWLLRTLRWRGTAQWRAAAPSPSTPQCHLSLLSPDS